MDVHAERRVISDRRAGTPEERGGRRQTPTLSEEERIEAAQFMLGTRQREEALLRATHLREGNVDEEHARETLAEMIHLQEAITARTAVPANGSGRSHRGHRTRVVDLDAKTTRRDKSARMAFVWTLLIGLAVIAAAIVVSGRQPF